MPLDCTAGRACWLLEQSCQEAKYVVGRLKTEWVRLWRPGICGLYWRIETLRQESVLPRFVHPWPLSPTRCPTALPPLPVWRVLCL